ncbi:hypothetical protein [Streptomyces sp. bgisy034]|uniref:hypothetical protein n=1 Tax=Streptomyces sp. bgisy034 TaxID=3413774 RepID=UPI003EBF8F05
MIDVTLIRDNPAHVQQALAKRDVHVDLDGFLRLDDDYRHTRAEVERLRGERKRISGEIAKRQRAGEDAADLRSEATAVGDNLTAAETKLAELEQARRAFIDPLPNLPDAEVSAGGKENNEVDREVGRHPEFSFAAKDHVELARHLDLVDYERGTKLGGSGFGSTGEPARSSSGHC